MGSGNGINGTVIPLIVVSLIWMVVGAVCPFLVPKGPNQGYALSFKIYMLRLLSLRFIGFEQTN